MTATKIYECVLNFDKILSLFIGDFKYGRKYLDIISVGLSNTSIKFVPYVLFLIILWFKKIDCQFKYRIFITKIVTAVFISIIMTRLIQNFMPERLRPLHNPELNLFPHFGLQDKVLEHWSSFPSDHAAVAFAFSTAIWVFSKSLGLCAMVWASLIVCLPRIYLGFHYFSDIIGGAVIGIFVTYCLINIKIPDRYTNVIGDMEKNHASVFYSIWFLILYQIL